MTEPKSFFLTADLHRYLVDNASPPDPVAAALRAETEALGPVAEMQIAPEQGAFFTTLTRLAAPRFAVEVGTFTGYSALCIARGLPPGGRLLCCDVSEEWTAVARRYWAAAGVADRIDLEIAPGIDTLRGLPDDAVIDFAFVDADKTGYPAYHAEIVRRLAPRGVIVYDNVLRGGAVLDPPDDDEATAAIVAFNDALATDPTLDVVMVPVGDGLSLVMHRDPVGPDDPGSPG